MPATVKGGKRKREQGIGHNRCQYQAKNQKT